MATVKKKTYTVGYLVQAWVQEDIEANSFDDALAIAGKREVSDMVDLQMEEVDTRLSIVQVGDFNVVNNM